MNEEQARIIWRSIFHSEKSETFRVAISCLSGVDPSFTIIYDKAYKTERVKLVQFLRELANVTEAIAYRE